MSNYFKEIRFKTKWKVFKYYYSEYARALMDQNELEVKMK